MKIHTELDYVQMLTLIRASGASEIEYQVLEPNGSRTHRFGYSVTLAGSGGRNNTGLYGAGNYNGATWDEWGAFFGALFEMDPEARCGGTLVDPVYRNASHFHYLTDDRFQSYVTESEGVSFLPTDTHPRHQWEHKGYGYNSPRHCTKCSATQPPFISGKDWS